MHITTYNIGNNQQLAGFHSYNSYYKNPEDLVLF